jgi:Bacterial TSP3 repeat
VVELLSAVPSAASDLRLLHSLPTVMNYLTRSPLWLLAFAFLVLSDRSVAQSVPLDTDQDGLPDSWEITYFNSLSQGPWQDTDADGLINLFEWQAGTNPAVADFKARPGQLFTERWNAIPGSTVASLTGSGHFRELADQVSFISSAEVTANIGGDYGIRVRGHLVAPVSGNYRFYLASDDASELWPTTGAATLTTTAGVPIVCGISLHRFKFRLVAVEPHDADVSRAF